MVVVAFLDPHAPAQRLAVTMIGDCVDCCWNWYPPWPEWNFYVAPCTSCAAILRTDGLVHFRAIERVFVAVVNYGVGRVGVVVAVTEDCGWPKFPRHCCCCWVPNVVDAETVFRLAIWHWPIEWNRYRHFVKYDLNSVVPMTSRRHQKLQMAIY